MVSTFLKFVWVAFVQYWGVWVTGTGLVGLALFLMGLTQTLTGRKMKPRTYAIVLFCVFWFLATFSAWHDADKNLSAVTLERARAVGDLGTCQGDLKTKGALLDQVGARLTEQQETINNQQTALTNQQGTVNSCVVSLGKMNPIIDTKIVTLALPAGNRKNIKYPDGTEHNIAFFEVVILTNHLTNPHGIIHCDAPFIPGEAQLHAQTVAHVIAHNSPKRISAVEYEITVSNSGARWEDENPIFLLAMSENSSLSCSFKQQ